jgi:mitochondrial import inner membrane translocase subunit TIM23
VEAARTSLRLRLNTVLNAVTRRGSFVGNNAGVLALIYNAINSTIDAQRKKHDVYGSVAAGAATGLVWKSTGACHSGIASTHQLTPCSQRVCDRH